MSNIIHPLPVDISWGRGWGTYNMECPVCGYIWVAVAPVGAVMNIACTRCDCLIEDVVWPAMSDEEPNDGAWLTGSLEGDF